MGSYISVFAILHIKMITECRARFPLCLDHIFILFIAYNVLTNTCITLQYANHFSNNKFQVSNLRNGTVCSYQITAEFLPHECQCGALCHDSITCTISTCVMCGMYVFM